MNTRSLRFAVSRLGRLAWMLAGLLLGLPAHAATLYWAGATSGAPAGGTGVWLGTNLWSDASGATHQNWANGNDALFQGTAGTVTAGAVSPVSLAFTAAYTIAGTGPITLAGMGSSGQINTNGNNVTISAQISGAVGLTKQGSGTLTLSGANNYSGATVVFGGELKVNGTHPAGSAITLASGSTLSGEAGINSAVTAAIDSKISRAAGLISTMTIAGGFTWNGSSDGAATIRLELDAGAVSDQIVVTGGNLTKGTATGATFKFDFANTGSSGTYTLVSVTGGTHNFALADLSYVNLRSGLSGTFDVSDPSKIIFRAVSDTPPTIAISAPSATGTATGPVTYTVTYTDTNFASSTLTDTNVTLNVTGTATGTVAVDSGTGTVRTVTISNTSGLGTLGISIAAGTGADVNGNLAPAAGPSTTFIVDSTVPTITSAATASGNYLQPFTYTITASKTVTFGATGLPPGLSVNTTTGVISGTPTSAGNFQVTVTGTDSALSQASKVVAVAIAAKAVTVSGLTVFNKTFDGTTTATLNPANVVLAGVFGSDLANVALNTSGATAVFADATPATSKPVTVTGLALFGSAAANYALTVPTVFGNILGLPATLTLSNLNQTYDGAPKPVSVATDPAGLTVALTYNGSATAPTDAGTYNVSATVSSGAYAGTSTTGTLVVGKAAQTITMGAYPDRLASDGPVTLAATASSGLPVSFSVTGPVVPSGNTLTNTGAEGTVTITAAQAGNQNFNAAASVVRTYVVTSRPQPGLFFGTFSGDRADAAFALLLRPDFTGVIAGYLPTVGFGFVRPISVDASGQFSTSFTPIGSTLNLTVRGRIAGNAVSGSVDPFTIAFSGTSAGAVTALADGGDVAIAAGAPVSGVYTLSAVGSTGTTVVTVFAGADGRAYVFGTDGTRATGVATTISNAGALSATLPDQTRVNLTFAANGTVDGTLTPTSGVATRFLGGAEAVAATQRMINMSARGRTNAAEKTLISGFVVRGDAPKRVVVRVAGPALTGFGVQNVLSNPALAIYNSAGAVIATNDDWGAPSPANPDIAAQMAAAGAFAFGAGSRDAAIVLRLAPGNYTVHAGGGDGVVLTEVYELLDAGEAIAQRKIVNFSVRGQVGVAGEPLTAGFVIGGNVPKRVLVRGIGPAIAFTGLGIVTNPKVTVYKGGTVVKENDDWFRDADAAQIAAAATSVGAFALPSPGFDAALIVVLEPGNYTAVVDGVAGATGIALVEVYELP